MQLEEEMNWLEKLLGKRLLTPKNLHIDICLKNIYFFAWEGWKAELIGGKEGSMGTAKALLLCPESTARSPAAEYQWASLN